MKIKQLSKELVEEMIPVLAEYTDIIKSRSEGRRLLSQNGLKLFLVEKNDLATIE